MHQVAVSTPLGPLACAVGTQFEFVDPQVYSRLHNPATGTWDPPVGAAPFQVSEVGGANYPRCTIDINGNAHVVWQAKNVVYHRIRLANGTWLAPQTVVAGRSSSDVAAGPNGEVWLVSRLWGGDVDPSSLEVRVWSSGAWAGPFVRNTGGAADAPRIDVDNSGRAHIVFKNGNNNGGVSYISFAGGFGPQLTVPGGTNTGSADIAVNRATGAVHAVYVKDWTNVHHFKLAAGAGSFVGGLIASGSVQVDDPTIAWLGGLQLVVTFNNNRGGRVDMTSSGNDGASWSAPLVVASAGGTSAPWVTGGAGVGYVVYNRRSESAVYFTPATGTPNQEPTQPTQPTEQRFSDVPTTHQYATAIHSLADAGIIRGYQDGRFGPNDTTLRAQMAAMIARAMGWDAETYANPFSDQGPVDFDLWRNVGTLAHYDVARGYTPQGCAAKGVPYPCFGPTDRVLRAQAISFITRAMVAKAYWVHATEDKPALYPNVVWDTNHRQELLT